MKPGSSVCVCHEVDHNACRDLVLAGRVASVSDLTRTTAAGSSCSLCVPYFERIIAHYMQSMTQDRLGGEGCRNPATEEAGTVGPGGFEPSNAPKACL